jgi:hypothetical protein
VLVAKWWSLVAVALALLACGDKDSPPAATQAPGASEPEAALRAAQAKLESSGGYTIHAEQTNFILPQWGGADAGTVQVDGRGDRAMAQFARTGEPRAVYVIYFIDEQTYFRRSTCNQTFRVPGGGADVLLPYLFARNGILAGATAIEGDAMSIRARLPGLGDVTVTLDSEGRLASIVREGASPLRWTFADWDEAPWVNRPTGTLEDRGPGGVPC